MYNFLVIFSQFNNSHFTIKAINSILKCDLRNIKLSFLIIDDCSSKYFHFARLETFSRNKSNIFLERNKKNLGYFSSLSNTMKKKIIKKFDYIFIGNNDIYDFSKYFFKKSIYSFKKNNNILAVSGNVKDEMGKSTFKVKEKYFLKKKELSDVAFILKRETISKIGIFQNCFNYEFCDLNYESRIKRKNFICYYNENISFKHRTDSPIRKVGKIKKNIRTRFKDLILLFYLEKKIFSKVFFKIFLRESKIAILGNFSFSMDIFFGIYNALKLILKKKDY